MGLAFTSEIKVSLIGQWGTDLDICEAAWASSGRGIELPNEKRMSGLINSLMRDKHGSPFEEGFFSFHISAPRAVRDEHVRHRIGSYSSSSLRYRKGDPLVYIPPPNRPMKKADGFKQIKPVYQPYSDEEYQRYIKIIERAYRYTYAFINDLEEGGFTETEAQRWITHDGLMVSYRARFNPRSLMAFLSLRTHEPTANHVSWPMYEIEQVARQMEQAFAEFLPITYNAFTANGRESP